mmetsp:Transcript_9949/g.14857  ORF Transcript_9949/g.14857 Transcript_9949/m.14857 type:complete len:189 (+) Transcript_9949:394-960(+)
MLFLGLVVLWFAVRYFYPPAKTNKVLVVLGSGGHTSEMLTYVSHMKSKPFALEFVCASSDFHSQNLIQRDYPTCKLHTVFRSRRVKQSYFTSVFTTLYSFLPAFKVVLVCRPNLVLTNGPGTALPLCYVAYLLTLLRVVSCKIVFVESFCRVNSLSLCGKLIYPIAQEFYVQWENLASKKIKYIGLLV